MLYTDQTVQNVSEDQLVFLVDSEFTRPKTSELLETKKTEKKMEMLVSMFEVNFFGLFTRTDFSRLFP